MSLIPKQFINSVIFITGEYNGTPINSATGFLIGRLVEDNLYHLYLVTNKHVIKNINQLNLRMVDKNTQNFIQVPVKLFNDKNEPNFYLNFNEEIDVCVIELPDEYINDDKIDINFINIDEDSMISNELIENDYTEGSLIYMLGFPMGTFDIGSLKPISRLGSIARISKSEILNSHCALADIQNFKGNSGSPILIRPELMRLNGTKPLEKIALIGVVSGFVPFKNNLKTKDDQVTEFYIDENSGLAVFIPIEYVIEIIDRVMPKIK